MPVQLFVSVTRFIVQYRIAKLLESALFYKKSKKDRLTFKQSPLQFLLYLLDTIEPVKKFENLDASAVLKKIWVSAGMDESRHHCRIVIGWDRTLEDEDKFLNWKDSILKMGKWLDLKVKEKKEKYAQLIIKFESNFQ